MRATRDRFFSGSPVTVSLPVIKSWQTASHSQRVPRTYAPLFNRSITLCRDCKLYSRWHWLVGWGTGEMISDLDGSLGSRCFLKVKNERTFECMVHTHLKLPGWYLVWNALLTKKVHMFLSRLNGGCEKIHPVSGSFWSNLKFFRMIDFTAWLRGWMKFYHYFSSATFVVLTADQ